MKFTTRLLPTLALIAQALTLDITSDTISRGTFNTNWGDTTIEEGAFWSIVDNDFSNFVGDLKVDGELYITSTSPSIGLNVNLGGIGNTYEVSGLLALNSVDSQLTPFYNTKASTFKNTGKMWYAGNGDTGIPTMAITASDWDNEGLIHFYQNYRSAGWVNLGWDLQTITNNGAICLTKMAYRQATSIKGNGCIDIGEDSTAWLAYTLQDISKDQTFIFSSKNGFLKTDAYTKKQTFKVVGWGDDNVIGVGVPIDSWSYSEDGILTIVANAVSQYDYDIGSGYDVSKIKKMTPDFGPGIGKVINGGLIYQDSPVNTERPSSCPACEALPEPPMSASSSLIPSSSSEESSATSEASSSSEVSSSVTSEASSSEESSASSSEVSSSEASSESSEVSSSATSSEASSSEVSSSATSSEASSSEVSSSATSSEASSSEVSSSAESSEASSSAVTSTECPECESSASATSSESASSEASSASVTSSEASATSSGASASATSSGAGEGEGSGAASSGAGEGAGAASSGAGAGEGPSTVAAVPAGASTDHVTNVVTATEDCHECEKSAAAEASGATTGTTPAEAATATEECDGECTGTVAAESTPAGTAAAESTPVGTAAAESTPAGTAAPTTLSTATSTETATVAGEESGSAAPAAQSSSAAGGAAAPEVSEGAGSRLGASIMATLTIFLTMML